MTHIEYNQQNGGEIARYEGPISEDGKDFADGNVCMKETIQNFTPVLKSILNNDNYSVEFMFLQDTPLWKNNMIDTFEVIKGQRAHLLEKVKDADDPVATLLDSWQETSNEIAGYQYFIKDRVKELGVPSLSLHQIRLLITESKREEVRQNGWAIYYEGKPTDTGSRPFILTFDPETEETLATDALALHNKEKKAQNMSLTTPQYLILAYYNMQTRLQFIREAVNHNNYHTINESYIPDELLQQPKWREIITFLAYLQAQQQNYPLSKQAVSLISELITNVNTSRQLLSAAAHINTCTGSSSDQIKWAKGSWVRERLDQYNFISEAVNNLSKDPLLYDSFMQRPADFAILEIQRKLKEIGILQEVYSYFSKKTTITHTVTDKLIKKLRDVYPEVGGEEMPSGLLNEDDLYSAENLEVLEEVFYNKLGARPPMDWLINKVGMILELKQYGMFEEDEPEDVNSNESFATPFSFFNGYKNFGTTLFYLNLLELIKKDKSLISAPNIIKLKTDPHVYAKKYAVEELYFDLEVAFEALKKNNINPASYMHLEELCTDGREIDTNSFISLFPLMIMMRDGLISNNDFPVFRSLLRRMNPYMY